MFNLVGNDYSSVVLNGKFRLVFALKNWLLHELVAGYRLLGLALEPGFFQWSESVPNETFSVLGFCPHFFILIYGQQDLIF